MDEEEMIIKRKLFSKYNKSFEEAKIDPGQDWREFSKIFNKETGRYQDKNDIFFIKQIYVEDGFKNTIKKKSYTALLQYPPLSLLFLFDPDTKEWGYNSSPKFYKDLKKPLLEYFNIILKDIKIKIREEKDNRELADRLKSLFSIYEKVVSEIKNIQ